MSDTRVWIGNDHGGLVLKERILEYFRENNITYNDIGAGSTEIVRYPYYAAEIASRVSRGEIDRGILICSTGIGMSIIANKFPNVRASLCSTTYDAKMTRAHNDSNILCLGGRTIGDFLAVDMVKTWLETAYMGGRHDISLGLIKEAEQKNFSGGIWSPHGKGEHTR